MNRNCLMVRAEGALRCCSRVLVLALILVAWSAFASAAEPFATLNPPAGITPGQTRSPHYRRALQVPPRQLSPEERKAYEARTDWLHQAKYGIAFHFLAGLSGHKQRKAWTSESWNAWVDGIDVEKTAEQAKEVGAGFVMLTIGQNCQYYCAPNPVLERHWQLQPGQYGSRRDLPMDLYQALEKRGIRLMLYMATDHQYRLPLPPELKGNARFDRWVEVCQWYSDHYGKKCSGWWVDGLLEFTPGYTKAIHDALRHGNPDVLIASGTYGMSDFSHGHANQGSWKNQQVQMLPYFGRWDPAYGIQWQVFQYLGRTWGAAGLGHSTAEMVAYSERVVRGGGVITFDIGTFHNDKAKPEARLEIPPEQMEQLRAIRDALREIPASDGRGK